MNTTVTLRRTFTLGALCLGLGAGALAYAAPQPLMRAAMGDLERAKVALASAVHDKDGHRVKALELVNQAMEEVRLGMEAGR